MLNEHYAWSHSLSQLQSHKVENCFERFYSSMRETLPEPQLVNISNLFVGKLKKATPEELLLLRVLFDILKNCSKSKAHLKIHNNTVYTINFEEIQLTGSSQLTLIMLSGWSPSGTIAHVELSFHICLWSKLHFLIFFFDQVWTDLQSTQGSGEFVEAKSSLRAQARGTKE